ncbi:MAG: hypothetical protein PHH85_03515 [Candidatus Methanoperedens sp.]|nr:hypothetical protein [Candidatus Methanoperedens sp.]
MVDAGIVEIGIFFLSGASMLINTGVWYRLGKIETTIDMCPTCQHSRRK